MKDLSEFIDDIFSTHVDADGKLDEFGTLALAFVCISVSQRICQIIFSRKEVFDSNLLSDVNDNK